MRFGSLFAGAGGLDLGLEAAGMTCAFQVELDDYATRVLEKNWPDVPRWRDIREVKACDLPTVELLCGGFPCQPHSLAGKRKASSDERDLWSEFFRLICEIRPRWVLAENVPGLLSSEGGRYFGRILRDLASVGFDAEWDCIPASALGAPHIRDRVWLVAYPNGERGWPAEVGFRGGSYQAKPRLDGEQRNVAHAHGERLEKRESPAEPGSAGDSTRLHLEEYSDANSDGLAGVEELHQGGRLQQLTLRRHLDGRALSWSVPRRRDAWPPESCPVGVAHGVAHRAHRLRVIGNGVEKHTGEHLGGLIMAAERARTR